jgi:tetratricopeptide (TPR) repeat protein
VARHADLILLWILPAALSCSGNPERPRARTSTEAEWIARVLGSTENNIDLIEAATLLAPERPGSMILDVLEPSIRKAREYLGDSASADEKIRALNEFVLPALTSALDEDLSWVRDAYASETGSCVATSLLYLLAADAIALPLEVVCPPGHVYLRYAGDGRKRNIETTAVGQNVPEAGYLKQLAHLPRPYTPLPEDPRDAMELFDALSRRQFAALLLLSRGSMRPEEAREKDYVTAGRLAPDLALAFSLLGGHYSRTSKFALGEESVTRAIGLSPRWPALYELRGALRGERGNPKGGLEDVDEGIRYAPHDPGLHGLRATLLGKLGKTQEAIEAWSRVLRLDPRQDRALRQRAHLYQEAKDYASAVEDLSDVIRNGHAGAPDFHARGACQAQRGDPRKALEDLTLATQLSPEVSAFWRDRGITHLRLKRPAEAIEDFDQAIERAPKEPLLYELRGQAYAILGDEERWSADRKKAKELSAMP